MIFILFILPPKLAGYGLVAGFLMAAYGRDRATVIRRVLKKGFHTTGRVVELRDDPGSLFSQEKRRGKAPVVEYITHSGNVHRHFSTTFQDPPPYTVGQHVEIWYQHFRSRRDAALQDDLPGKGPTKVFLAGCGLLILSFLTLLPRFMDMLSVH